MIVTAGNIDASYSPNLLRKPKPVVLNGHAVQLNTRIHNAVVTDCVMNDNCMMLTVAWCHTEGTRRRRKQITHSQIIVCKKQFTPDGQDYLWEEVTRTNG